MRNVFLALVAANVFLFAWQAWVVPPPPVGPPPSSLPRLTLLSEVPPDLADLRAVSESAVEPLAPSAVPLDLGQNPADGAAADGGATDGPAPADGAQESDSPVPVDQGEPPVQPAEQPAELVAAGEPAAGAGAGGAVDGQRCVSIGPFRDLPQAATAQATLRGAGHEPTQRVAEGEIWMGYWVYLEAIPTVTEAEAILARVRAAGLTDSYVIPNSDSGNLVSIGVFTEVAGVRQRREELRAMGYEPAVVDRTRRATVYWIDLLLGADATVDFDALQPPGRIIRLDQVACPTGAA